jgi:flagellar hook-basal body complex protein FliE
MSQMEIDRVLAQIRAFSSQGAATATQTRPPAASGASEFAKLLGQGIEQVNQTQQSAASLAAAFERGTPGVDLPQVMIEMQKASVSFRALTEVRNRLVNAYQEIMNMPL